MKKVALIILAVSCFTFGKAQLKPEAGSIGLGFRVSGLASVAFTNFQGTGLSGTIADPLNLGDGVADGMTTLSIPQEMLFGRYYLASDLALRFGLGINSSSMNTEFSDSTVSVDGDPGVETGTTSQKSFSFGISAGIEKHFASAASRLDPYAGAQIMFASLGSTTWEGESSDPTDPASSSSYAYTVAGGSHFGFDLLAGFNYFFSDNFAIGAEMSWGFHSTSTGGDWDFTSSATNGGTTVTSTNGGNMKMSSGGLGVGSTAGVNASIFW